MPQTPQLNGLSAVGASVAIPIKQGITDHVFESWFLHNVTSASPISALTIKVQGSNRGI